MQNKIFLFLFSYSSYSAAGGKKETLIEKPSVQKGLQAAAQQFVFASLTSLDGVGRDGGEEDGGEDKKQIDKEQVGNKPSVEKGLKSAARNIVFASVASANDGGVVRLKGGDENAKSDNEDEEEEDFQDVEDEEEDDFADYEEGWGTERCNGDTNNYHNDSYSGSEVTDSEDGYGGGGGRCGSGDVPVALNGSCGGGGGVCGGGVGDFGVRKTPRENAYISDVHIVMQ